MKVVLLCGSPRPDGNTSQVITECAHVIQEHGLETEIISLAGKKIESCTACNRCAAEGNCVLEEVSPISSTASGERRVHRGIPCLFGTARGDVMAALQRIGMVSRSTDRFLTWKVGGPIAVARRGGHTATIQEMLMFFLINNMIVPGSTYWNIVFGWNPGECWKDVEGMNTVRVFAENVARLIAKISS